MLQVEGLEDDHPEGAIMVEDHPEGATAGDQDTEVCKTHNVITSSGRQCSIILLPV